MKRFESHENRLAAQHDEHALKELSDTDCSDVESNASVLDGMDGEKKIDNMLMRQMPG